MHIIFRTFWNLLHGPKDYLGLALGKRVMVPYLLPYPLSSLISLMAKSLIPGPAPPEGRNTVIKLSSMVKTVVSYVTCTLHLHIHLYTITFP